MATLAIRFSWWHASSDAEQIDREALCAGATFARMTRAQVTETVRVLGVVEDEGGIVHVRYDSGAGRAYGTGAAPKGRLPTQTSWDAGASGVHRGAEDA